MVLEKNLRYKYAAQQAVDIGGENALEWNYCAEVRDKHRSLLDSTWEVYARKSMIFKIQMMGAELREVQRAIRSDKPHCAVAEVAVVAAVAAVPAVPPPAKRRRLAVTNAAVSNRQ
jgi:hypothetical protein